MLDQERLNELLGFYISKFPEVSNTPQYHEMLKWRAVAYCVNHFDIEEPDFGAMLKNAFSVWRSLIDYGGVTPLTGIVKLCESGAGEEVRTAFRDLLEDEGNEPLNERWNRILVFRDRINQLLEEAKLGGWRYKCDNRCVMMILGFLRPETDYMFKSKPVINFALYALYDKYIGAGKSFHIENYYGMCEELIEELHKRSATMDMIRAGICREAEESGYASILNIDAKDHLAAYDVIYTIYTYGFFEQEDQKKKLQEILKKTAKSNTGKTGPTKKQKESAAAEEARRQMLEMLDRELKTSLDMVAEQEDLINEIGIPPVAGMEIHHVKYGKGTILTQNGKTLSIQFDTGTRKMDLVALFTGGSIENVPDELQEACAQLKVCFSEMESWQHKANALKSRLK